ncbi:hypothetical protein J4E82_011333 [Alternaria postmessia]|jgi:hypothetical protein|uniref:uncharacterized protein n=1 Tax=Alternaria postmessia TaxID=1187938 RepID=UPI002224E8AD|nr:uncharacterized protein J4E82_011333 [Alternaria postmessia]KAI5365632.1 hypothetical protein J4E82_011333 [Alternaria postmessia]
MGQGTGNYNYTPLRKGIRRIYKNDGSFPPKDAPADALFLTGSIANYHMVTTGDIRILKLLPGSFGDPLRCRSRIKRIESNPKYDALSYMWGDSSLTGSMFLDNKPFPVTRSLENALRHVRLRGSARYLWADAVCINQRDDEEKGNQIHLMKEVYSRASTVRVWIDVELSLEDPVVQKLFTLRLQDNDDQLGDDPEYWKVLLPLLQNDYWDRLWIQQELVFAPELVFYCRGVTIPGNCLMALQLQVFRKLTGGKGPFDNDDPWGLFRPLESTIKAPSRNLACWRAMTKSKVPVDPLTLKPDFTLLIPKVKWKLDPRKMSSHLSTNPIYLLGMLRQSQALKLTDPRDRVRAVLNLVIDYDDDGAEADYSQTVAELYHRVAWLLPFECNSLLFLAMAKTSINSNDDIQDLPSWAPNWSSPGNAEYFLSAFHAAGDLPMYSTPFQADMEDGILHARGFKYATVDRTLSTTDNSSTPFSVLSSLFITVVKSPMCHYGDIKKLASTLTGPAMAELRIARDYFSESEAILYTGILLDYSFVTPGIRIADLFPYATKVYKHSQRELRFVLLALRKFRHLRPSCLRWLDLEKESAAVGRMVDQTERFGHFIQLVHKTLFSGRLASISPIVTPKSAPSITLAITEGKALIRPGDEIWILFGCPTPMVLRRAMPYFLVASPTYIFDIMNGEAMDGVETPDDKSGGWLTMWKRGMMIPSPKTSYVSGKCKWNVEVIRLG